MHKLKPGLLLAAVIAAALVAGCGGGGGGASDIAHSDSALVAFMKNLIAGSNETGEPIDVNALSLAVDDRATPDPL